MLTAARVDEIAAKIKAAGKRQQNPAGPARYHRRRCSQVVRLANFFIKDGTLATLVGQKFTTQTFTADPAKFSPTHPCVLVNRGTYGAAGTCRRCH